MLVFKFIALLLTIALLITTPAVIATETAIPPLTLAETYQGKADLKLYWVSEKLDGVRAFWNGRQLISRQGHVYPAPSWFIQGFPDQALDGELWLGRQQFETLLSYVSKKQPIDSEWKKIKYYVFDLPGLEQPFQLRLQYLQQLVSASNNPYLFLVDQFRVDNKKELQKELKRIVDLGGEGLMLHHADAYYHVGRNRDLLKLKPYYDAEAEVIAHIAGKGKYQGMMGALLVKTADGIEFKIGSGFSDTERINPAKIGSIISYKYHGKTTKGIPRFASFLRRRKQFK